MHELPGSPALPEQDVAVSVRNASKAYRLFDRPTDRLKEMVFTPFGRVYGRDFWALREVSFEVRRGESFGIIGRNGSGKSTLLQMIAGVLQPSGGDVQVHGKVAALLELGSGFNPELTGRENVYLNAALMGMSRQETESRLDEIIAFADIGDFIDQPVKLYSSGMFVRLAFAVSTSVDADILVIDEALAVGDVFFRQKCYKRLEALRAQGTAIILVSHAMGDVEQFCERVLLLDHGNELFLGSAAEAVRRYYLLEHSRPSPGADLVQDGLDDEGAWEPSEELAWPPPHAFVDLSAREQVSNGWARCLRLAVCDQRGRPCQRFEQGQTAYFCYEFEILHDLPVPVGGVLIQSDRGVIVHGKRTLEYGTPVPMSVRAGSRLQFRQAVKLSLAVGEYTFEVGLVALDPESYLRRQELPHVELDARAIWLCTVPTAGQIAIVFRQHAAPVQLLHHGVADLPGECQVAVLPGISSTAEVQAFVQADPASRESSPAGR